MESTDWTFVEESLLEALHSLVGVWDALFDALPSQERDRLREEIVALLAEAEEEGDALALVRARQRLQPYEEAYSWLEEVRERALHDTKAKGPGGMDAFLPGDPGPMERPCYRCPQPGCHYVWYQRVAGVRPPNCPVHRCPLEREGEEREGDDARQV